MPTVDLLIVNPSAAHGIYGPLGDQLIAVEPPQWCRIIAGYIRRHGGYSVAILDAEALHLDGAAAAERAETYHAAVVCVAVYGHQPSASTQQMWGAREFCREFTKISDAVVVMVGGHPSALPVQTLREEIVDFVAAGEGPQTILGLLEADPLESIPGLVWSDGDRNVRVNDPAPLMEMAELEGVASWDLLPMGQYRAHNWQCFGDLTQRQPYASIYTSLGCPYKCSFCCINAPFNSNRYRMRHPDNVINEVALLYEKYGVKTLKITDEMFVLNEKHYTEICEGLVRLRYRLGVEFNIWAYARVDTINEKTLKLMRRAGIRWLALGIESGSKHVRDSAQKKLKRDDIVEVVKTIQDADINVIGNFMFGLRDDDENTMAETLELAMKCLPDFANFYSTMAYPGSGLYAEAVKKGWRLPSSWRGYSQHNDDCQPLDTEHCSSAIVLAFRDSAFNDFYRHPRYLHHVQKKFGDETLAHITEMIRYKLKRKILQEKVG